MKLINAALVVCLSTLILGCDDEPSRTAATPPSSEGGKADENSSADALCGSAEDDYLQCRQSSPDGVSCEGELNEEYGSANLCCAQQGDHAFCDLSGSSWCESAASDLAACELEAPSDVCQEYQASAYPLFELCRDESSVRACEGISADFEECGANTPDDLSCGEYLHEEYPWSGNCCALAGFDEVCRAYTESFNESTCVLIASRYDDCVNSSPADFDCDVYLQDSFPLGGNCCEYDGFEAVCSVYGS